MTIRPALPADLPAVAAIYGHYVRESTATFETEAPDVDEFARRWAEVRARGLPWLVAQADDGSVAGYASCNWFKPRAAYRFAVENSIYLAPDAQRRGTGRALLQALCTAAEAAGVRQVIAVIGGTDHASSIGLHAALGFRRVGLLEGAGWKFGRWIDVVLMQRTLGDGAASAPQETVGR